MPHRGGGLEDETLLVAQAFRGRVRKGGQVVVEAVELEGHRARIVRVEQEEVEDRLELGLRPVPATVGDDALGRREHRLEAGGCRSPCPVVSVSVARRRRSSWMRPLEAPAGIHEPPAGIAHHALVDQPRQGQQALHDPLEHALHVGLGFVERAAKVEDLTVERPDGQPGVIGQLIAHAVGGVEEVMDGVGQRARPGRVDDQLVELGTRPLELVRPDAVGETGPGRGDRGQGDEQHAQTGRSGWVGVAGKVVAPVVDDSQQPGHVLGPLGVTAQPEEVLGDPRRDRGPGIAAA